MTTPALRRAWQEWCAFADGLDLADGSPDVAALHARLFRLCGSHALDAGGLRAAWAAARDALGPWLDGGAGGAAGDLERLRRAMTACEPGWRALLGLTGRQTDWREVERVALSAGLAWPEGPFWAAPWGGRGLDLLALRGRDLAAALATVEALLRVMNHPRGLPLFRWARDTRALARPAEAFAAAALFRDAAAQGALQEKWLAPLGWADLPGRLLGLCQDVCLRFLARLNEPTPGAAAKARPVAHKRAVPEPLPVEPYFRDLPGSAGFLRAVAEEPLEDAHRLAFADWLDEQGHADRARFIRLQCEHDRLPELAFLRRGHAEQIAALLKKHGAAWTKGLPRGQYVAWGESGNFQRGLLERVSVTAPLRRDGYGRLFAAADLRGLCTRLYDSSASSDVIGAGPLLELPWLSRLVSLELTDGVDATDLRALAAAPALAGLVHLGLRDCGIGPTEVAGLAEGLRLPNLVDLDLTDNSLGDEGARLLAGCPALAGLRRLRLGRSAEHQYSYSYRAFGSAGTRALASSPALSGLEHLDLSGTSPDVAALAASPFLTRLSSLVLDRCRVGDGGAAALAASPFLKRLSCLGLREAEVRDEGAQALAASDGLAGLAVLDLGDNGYIGPEGARALAASPRLAGLRALGLARTGLDGPAAQALAASPHLNNLAVLDLEGNDLPPAARAALRKRWPFVRL
jgi:uncharacterized protein (TIGR02996 family)